MSARRCSIIENRRLINIINCEKYVLIREKIGERRI
jgi:hypothetical protein